MKRILLCMVVALPSIVRAGEPSKEPAAAAAKPAMMSPRPASKEFEMIKSLVGDWKGTADMHGQKGPTMTSFRLTSAGSAVVETMGAGTPHEMTNVYHEVDGKLMMTHYCAVGNAPEMRVAKSDDKSLAFEAIRANGIDPETTPHMHGLAYVLTDKDHLTATWTSANMGQEHKTPSVFSYTRVAEDKPAK